MAESGGTAHGDSRLRVLYALRRLHGPVPLCDIAEAVGLHPNTVREHLDALVEDGRAAAACERSGARGRPRMLYRVTPAGALPSDPGEDALRVAGIILGAFGQDESKARASAVAAGARWGEELAGTLDGLDEPLERLLTTLDAAGSDPVPIERGTDGTGRVHVAVCPYRSLAAVRPDVVCDIHAAAIARLVDGAEGEGVAVEVRRDSGRDGGACTIALTRAPEPS